MADSKLDQSVASFLECAICLQEYKDPRGLPCLHSFCLPCLTLHISKSKDKDGFFQCPECRCIVPAPQGDAKEFPKHFLLNSMKDASTLISQKPKGSEVPPQCRTHKKNIDWFCQTCKLPGCAECMLRQHKLHETDKLETIASKLEPDLIALSKAAAQRLAALQQISSDLDTSEKRVKLDADEACQEISRTADSMRALINEYEEKLLNKVKQAKKTFEEQIQKSRQEYEWFKTFAPSFKLFEEKPDTARYSLRSVLHSSDVWKLLTQNKNVPSVQWQMSRTSIRSGDTSEGNLLGQVTVKTLVEEEKSVHLENVTLGTPVQITKRQDKSKFGIGGIAPIYSTMFCLTVSDEFLWVYTDEGNLKQKVSIPEIKQIFGVAAVDGKHGKLGVVDFCSRAVHFVTLSKDLEIQQHSATDVPLAPDRISIGGQRRVIVGSARVKKFAVLTADGELLRTVQVDIPDREILLECMAETKSGYVICESKNEKVYFTDTAGRIINVFTDRGKPRWALQTSWGHVLIAVFESHDIKVFSEVGDYLGRLHDNGSQVTYPTYIHADEAGGRLYVSSKSKGTRRLLKYKFTPGDLPPLPITHAVTRMNLSLELADL